MTDENMSACEIVEMAGPMGVAGLSKGNPIPMACIGTMLASPAAPFLPGGGAPNALIHFHEGADYQLGKSTCLYAGATVWGLGAPLSDPASFVEHWNMTLAAAEHIFPCHNNIGIALDNAGAVGRNELKKIARVFTAGVPRNPEKPSWELFGLSEGPFPIDAPCVVNIPFPADAFTNLHGCADTGDFAHAIAVAARENYGHAGPAFVRWLLNHQDEARDQLVDLVSTGIKFGLRDSLLRPIAACAALAADAQIVPWSAGEMLRAFAHIGGLCDYPIRRELGGGKGDD